MTTQEVIDELEGESMRKPGFSVRQHIETGQILKGALRCLWRVSNETKAAYPLKMKAISRLENAYKSIYQARYYLESEMMDENPAQPSVGSSAFTCRF